MHRVDSSAFATIVILSILAACSSADGPSRAATGSPPATITTDASSEAGGCAAPPCTPSATVVTTPTLEEQGETLVRERGCARCHQSPNRDDGVLSGQTTPRAGTRAYASNLTPDIETGLGGWSDIMIAGAIRDGKDENGAPLCLAMPRFADLTDEEMGAIISYLRALDRVERPIPKSQCDGTAETDGDDAGPRGDAGAADGGCASWAPPSTNAGCHACATPPCQPNGCFNGWWCATLTSTCRPAPDACAP